MQIYALPSPNGPRPDKNWLRDEGPTFRLVAENHRDAPLGGRPGLLLETCNYRRERRWVACEWVIRAPV